MPELRVRIATLNDIEDITDISRTTWDGDDYLEGEAPGWIRGGSLYVGELNGKVVGTFRFTPMPDGVLWLEGLRIHTDYQGRGYGRQLADFSFVKGKRILQSGEAECMEFSTYILNNESIHISMSQGFKVVNRFILMTREGFHSSAEIERTEPSSNDFMGLTGHIPIGWKYPRLCPEGIEWALKRCDAYRIGNVCFLRKKDSDETTPLRGAFDDPDGFLDGAEAAALTAGDSHSCIIVHESWKDLIERAYHRGYNTWEPVDNYNVLVFRYTM